MNERVVRLRADALVFDALMAMMHEDAYHVVVNDGSGPEAKPVGVISDQDVSRAQGHSPAFMLERTEKADSVGEVARIGDDATEMLLGLEDRGVQPEGLIAINIKINDRIMVRLLGLVEAELKETMPETCVELPWAWLSLAARAGARWG